MLDCEEGNVGTGICTNKGRNSHDMDRNGWDGIGAGEVAGVIPLADTL